MPETDGPYTFEDVATNLCKGAPPNQKLAQHFRRWARPMEDHPHVPLTPPMTRKEVVEALKELDAAATTILTGLTNCQQMHFVMSPEFPPFDRLATRRLLTDLRERCRVGMSPLLSEKRKVKSGPETYPGHGANPRLFCASAILLAWQVVHGKYPGVRNPWATQAAEALFHLLEPRRPPRRTTKDDMAEDRNPLTAWRIPFEKASKQEPLLGGLHDLYVESVRSAIADDVSSGGSQLIVEATGDLIPAENSGNLVPSLRLANQSSLCHRDTDGVRRLGCPRRPTMKAGGLRAKPLKTSRARHNGRLKDQDRTRKPSASRDDGLKLVPKRRDGPFWITYRCLRSIRIRLTRESIPGNRSTRLLKASNPSASTLRFWSTVRTKS